MRILALSQTRQTRLRLERSLEQKSGVILYPDFHNHPLTRVATHATIVASAAPARPPSGGIKGGALHAGSG